MYSILAGSVDVTIYFRLRDSGSGLAKTGLVYNSAGAVCRYTRQRGTATAITLATLAAADSAHSDGGFKEIDGSNAKGLYRLDLPDAAVATGSPFVIISIEFDGIIEESVLVTLDALKPTVAGRTLDVSAAGEAGVDWANVGSPTTTQDLSGTTVATVSGNVVGSIGSLATQAKADVNAEVDGALNTAIPGSPVADSINERLATLDDNYTATRAGYLDNLNGHVPQSGDSFSRLGAPAGASIAADIANVISVLSDGLDVVGTAVSADLTIIKNRLGAWTGTGANSILGAMRALFRSDADAAVPADINADLGGGAGTADNTTDSLQASQAEHDATQAAIGGLNDPDIASIVDAVWDEARGDHTTAGTFGEGVKVESLNTQAKADVNAEADTALADINLDHLIPVASTVNDAGATTASFITALTETTDDHYNDMVILFTSGALVGQARRISDYVGATKTVSVLPILTEAPANGDGFVIVSGVYLQVVAERLNTQAKADVNAEVDTALADIMLDHLMAVALPVGVSDMDINSAMGFVLDVGSTWTYDRETDSLEASQIEHDATQTALTTIQNRIGDFAGTGLNTIKGFLQAVFRKDAGVSGVNTPSEINEVENGTPGSADPATVSLQALADNTAGGVADAVWDEVRSGHVTPGTFGEGVIVATNNDKTAYALTTTEHTNIADALLKRDMAAVAGAAARSVLNAVRFLRNRRAVSGSTLVVYAEDDMTVAWSSSVVTDAAAEPITEVDPS